MAESQSLDLNVVMRLLAETREIAVQLDGVRVNLEINSPEIRKRKAVINRRLRYAAHLADLARVELTNQYYVFQGEDPPEIIS